MADLFAETNTQSTCPPHPNHPVIFSWLFVSISGVRIWTALCSRSLSMRIDTRIGTKGKCIISVLCQLMTQLMHTQNKLTHFAVQPQKLKEQYACKKTPKRFLYECWCCQGNCVCTGMYALRVDTVVGSGQSCFCCVAATFCSFWNKVCNLCPWWRTKGCILYLRVYKITL